MLTVKNKKDCCGCQACYEACPSKCISMVSDEEGFLYPRINPADCVNCSLCERVCPQLNSNDTKLPEAPRSCYAAISKDLQIRLLSSSGGVFSLLANKILEQNGVVFGARFDDQFAVYHSYTETPEGLPPFRGSKYVQSDLRGAYSQVRQFLQANRPVLFTGTPCQIAGLRGYLGQREYDQLYLVSVVCHGAPSPLVWKDYLSNVTHGIIPTDVSMRNKDNGWSRYNMLIRKNDTTLLSIPAADSPFIRAFLSNLTLRPACYHCKFRGSHGSDLTLGDYWGIERVHPEMMDDKGTSLILTYTQKGKQLLFSLDIDLRESRYEDAVNGNPSIRYPSPEPVERVMFWREFRRHGAHSLEKYTTYSTGTRLRRIWARVIRKIQRG